MAGWVHDPARSLHRRTWRIAACVALGATAFTAGRGGAAEVVLIDAPAIDGHLLSLDASGTAVFDVVGRNKSVPLESIVSYGEPAPSRSTAYLLFADNGLIAADAVSVTQERVAFDSRWLGRRELPLERVAAVVLRAPVTAAERAALDDRVLAVDADGDWALLDNGDELTGALSELGPQETRLITDLGEMKLDTRRVVAVRFNPHLAAPPIERQAPVLVGWVDGSRLSVERLTFTGDTAAFDALGDMAWTTPAESIVFVQPLAGRAVYMSDLTPAGYRHLPFLSQTWPYRFDRNAAGGPLMSGRRRWFKGIGMHSTSRLSFKLSEPFERLDARLAVDDSAENQGSVVFRIFVGAEERYRSPVVRGGEPPMPISVDIRGGEQLSLIVDYADRGDVLDRANWLDARLIPATPPPAGRAAP